MSAQKPLKRRDTSHFIHAMRNQCIQKRGVCGIKILGAIFRSLDKDFSNKLSYREFKTGIKHFGMDLTEEDLQELFRRFDKDRNNTIDFKEFLTELRPPMAQPRKDVINEVFNKLDRNGDGKLMVDDLKELYKDNVKRHPKFKSGEWTEDEVLRSFLDSFDTPGQLDGKVTREEFLNYYAGVSITIDDDCYFDLMMRSSWGLPHRKIESRNNNY